MIEIRSEYQGETENKRGFFAIYMARNGKWLNTAIVPESLDDPENAVESIKSMIGVLLNESFSELKDPLYKMKKELMGISERKKFLVERIKEMEAARKEITETNP